METCFRIFFFSAFPDDCFRIYTGPSYKELGKNETFVFLSLLNKTPFGASLVAQWLRICLPMQGTRVRALVWEDPTCRGATRPVRHNY